MKTVKHLALSAAFAAGLLGLTGCADTAGTVVQTDHLTLTSATLIHEDNARLARRVRVTGVAYDTVNGLQRVHISLASTRHGRFTYDYRICWFDANGMEIDGDAKPYRSLILEGRDAVTVTGVANSAAGVSSKLRIRETSQSE